MLLVEAIATHLICSGTRVCTPSGSMCYCCLLSKTLVPPQSEWLRTYTSSLKLRVSCGSTTMRIDVNVHAVAARLLLIYVVVLMVELLQPGK
jgi:hypothetical protein